MKIISRVNENNASIIYFSSVLYVILNVNFIDILLVI
jgi:hypothetical protein